MTDHPDRLVNDPHRPSPPPGDPSVPPDDTLAVPASVPITVWRLDDRDDDKRATEPGAGFASRLARRLILVYTRRGDTVVDFDHDGHLRDAAHGTGRAYLAIKDAGHVAELDQVPQPVTLVTVRWPRHQVPAPATTVTDLFTACRLMTSETACVIAAVRPTPTGATFADHERALRTAADAAGFTCLRSWGYSPSCPCDRRPAPRGATTAVKAATPRDHVRDESAPLPAPSSCVTWAAAMSRERRTRAHWS